MIDGKIMYGPIKEVSGGQITITDQGFTYTGKARHVDKILSSRVELDVRFDEITDWEIILGNYNISCKDYRIIFASNDKMRKPAFEYLYDQYQAARNKRLNEEHHLRCNICGKIFIYTLAEDLRIRDEMLAAQKQSLNASMNTLFQSQMLGKIQEGQAAAAEQAAKDKAYDLRRCPNCKSNNVTEISQEEAVAAFRAAAAPAPAPAPAPQTTPEPAAPVFSPLDELRKLKELLDLGIVTQEEFEITKKRLLNL